MKTVETVALEKAIRRATYKMGTFGCYEVTIGYGGKERVDHMTYDTKGIFRCYEVKVSKADFHSAAVKSFVGHYNYYVLTRELYDQVKEEIPLSLSGFALKPENLSTNKGMVYAVINPHTGSSFHIKNCQKPVTRHSNRQIL